MRLVLAVCSLAGLSLCLAPCDDARFNIKIDLPDMEAYQCPGDPWPVPDTVIPSLALWHPEQEALQYCMDRRIEYNVSIPTSGAHRPSGARYGEYEFCPPPRWVTNLQHGAVAFLYHPCVNPILKENLRLLASACFYKHVITPHVTLTKDRPLAMVAWTATLEMQRLNLTEAKAWLRESVGRAPERQVKDVPFYDYLLKRRAVKGLRAINKKLCEGDGMILKKHFELAESRQGKGNIRWGIEHGAINRLKLRKRRKRAVSVASSSNSSSPEVISMQTVAEHLKGRFGDSLGLRARVGDGTTLAAKESTSQEHSQVSRAKSVSGDYDRTMPNLGGNPRSSHGRDGENVTAVTPSVLENIELAQINFQEGTNAKEIMVVAESLRSAVQETRNSVGSPHSENLKTVVRFRVSKALELTGTDHSRISGILQGTAPLTDSGENLEMTNTSQLPPLPDHVEPSSLSVKVASNQENIPEDGLLKVNESEPLVRLGNHSQILLSSEPVQSKKNGENDEATNEGKPVALNEDSRASSTKDLRGGMSKLEITFPKNSSTLSPAASRKEGWGEEGTGKKPCHCLKGVPHELESHNHQQAMAQAGILGDTKRIQGGQALSRAAVDMFVRTPRTEEAAWAAAALTFLFVLLTLAVLYTRLWRKFRKSESLYWAADSDQEGQETVSAVIKRRLTVGQARRKRRQNYKKRPLVLYEDVSDSSD